MLRVTPTHIPRALYGFHFGVQFAWLREKSSKSPFGNSTSWLSSMPGMMVRLAVCVLPPSSE